VIPAGNCDDPALLFLGCKLQQPAGCPADLERTGRLQAFQFEKDRHRVPFTKEAGWNERGMQDVGFDSPAGSLNVFDGNRDAGVWTLHRGTLDRVML